MLSREEERKFDLDLRALVIREQAAVFTSVLRQDSCFHFCILFYCLRPAGVLFVLQRDGEDESQTGRERKRARKQRDITRRTCRSKGRSSETGTFSGLTLRTRSLRTTRVSRGPLCYQSWQLDHLKGGEETFGGRLGGIVGEERETKGVVLKYL